MANTGLSSVDVMQGSLAQMGESLEDTANTSIKITSATESSGHLFVSVENDGSEALSDFEHWDVFLEWQKNKVKSYDKRLPYDESDPPPNDYWSLSEIQMDGSPEVLHPGVLDPGETAVLRLGANPQKTSDVRVVVSTANGVTSPYIFVGS